MNAKSIVEKAFAKARGEKPKKSSKKEPLPRKPAQIAASASPKNRPSFRKSKADKVKTVLVKSDLTLSVLGPEIAPLADDLALPETLKVENRKPLTPEEQARVAAAVKAAPSSVADKQGELRAAQLEQKKEKARVRVEQLLAKKAGKTTALPLQGKTALRAIAASVQEQITNGQIKPTVVPAASNSNSQNPPVLQKSRTGKAPGKPAGASKAKKARVPKPAKENRTNKPRNGSTGGYDWDEATAKAKSGKIPALPPFKSYDCHIQDMFNLASKRDEEGLKEYAKRFVNRDGGRVNMFRYYDLLLTALKN